MYQNKAKLTVFSNFGLGSTGSWFALIVTNFDFIAFT